MLGPPDTVVELGNTEVTEEIFMDYLSSLGETTYRFVCLSLVFISNKSNIHIFPIAEVIIALLKSFSLYLFLQWGQVQIV